MRTYKLKYNLWYIQANSLDEAKAKAVAIVRKDAERLIDVEIPKPKDPPRFWKTLFLG